MAHCITTDSEFSETEAIPFVKFEKPSKSPKPTKNENPLQGIFVDLLTSLEGKACLLENGEIQHPKPMNGFFQLVNLYVLM